MMQPMETLLSQCSALIFGHMPLIASVLVAGLVGSATHCSVMCAPMAAANMLSLREHRKPQSTMLYYHAGRIGTYVALGITATLASRWVFSGALERYTHILLVLAGIMFIASALMPRKTHKCTQSTSATRSDTFSYLARGAAMGFMPCGMIYAVLLSVATLGNAPQAALVMFVFGLSTAPMLQLAGFGALKFNRTFPTLTARASRSVMALNGLFLCVLGSGFVTIS
jgi:sulfite exporter TauE/SafE